MSYPSFFDRRESSATQTCGTLTIGFEERLARHGSRCHKKAASFRSQKVSVHAGSYTMPIWSLRASEHRSRGSIIRAG